MKKLKFILLLLPGLILILLQCCAPSGRSAYREDQKEIAVRKLLESRKFQFIPTWANPTGGRTIQLDPGFRLKLQGDTLLCYLPYYGVAYTAPMNTSSGPLDLTTGNFVYTSEKGKRGSTYIRIKLPQPFDARELSLDVTATGYATLAVRFDNRQGISFSGEVAPW